MTTTPAPAAETGSRLEAADLWIVASFLLSVGGTGLAALLADPRVIGVAAILALLLLVGAWRVTGSPRLGWLLLFGLVVGVLELGADWYHVVRLGSLVYSDYFGFRLLASPSYMPVGWWITAVQFGYLALRVAELWRVAAALATVALLGMTIPPWYEEFAAAAKAWRYTPGGPTLSETPLWVIVTYGGCTLAIGVSSLLYRERARSRALGAGCAAGAGIFLAGLLGYSLLG